jgi:hypothetical protein
MRGGRRRAKGEREARLRLALPLLAAPFFLSGCGSLGIGLGGGQASTGAHTVFLARDGCATFVARTLGRDFLLAEATDGAYTPSLGDVLAGPSREGPSVFALYPSGSASAGTPSGPPAATVPLDVRAIGLPLAEARARLDAACPAR